MSLYEHEKFLRDHPALELTFTFHKIDCEGPAADANRIFSLLVEMISKGEMGDSNWEGVVWLVESGSKSKVGERRWERGE